MARKDGKMEQKQILLANREEANYLERKGIDLSKYTRVDPKELRKENGNEN